MKIDFAKAALAAVVGTLALDVLGFALTGTFWDIPTLLADKLQSPFVVGLALHYGLGFTLTVIYVAIAPSLPGGRWSRPLIFVTAETVLGVYLFMFPLLGAGFAGLGLGLAVPFISMARHIVFGLALGWLYPVERRVAKRRPQPAT
ncbi:MAG: hypothetical protein RLO52_18905 [Sandaracinaceae bacterium]|nr:MAG: hypothetical protein EVA89_25875 [Sandaracinaceae bacterium]